MKLYKVIMKNTARVLQNQDSELHLFVSSKIKTEARYTVAVVPLDEMGKVVMTDNPLRQTQPLGLKPTQATR